MKEFDEELRQLLQGKSILYAEDDPNAQAEVARALQRVCDNVILVPNGQEGFDQFQEYKPDLIVTDIQMPIKTGLDMAKGIKEISPDTPIIITTAFNDERYFMEAIEVGIDSFLRKPISKKSLYKALHSNASSLQYKKQKQELEELQRIQQINSFSLDSIKNLSNLFPFPILVYEDGILLYKNSYAKENICEDENILLQDEHELISKYNLEKCTKRKVKICTPSGRSKIYWAYPNSIEVGFEQKNLNAYIFVDITMLEYQKLKLSNFDAMSYLKNLKTKKTAKKPSPTSITNEEEIPTQEAKQKDSTAKKQRLDSDLDDHTQAILRKTHFQKTSAASFVQELDEYYIAELEELQQTQNHMQNLIDDFNEFHDIKLLPMVAKQLGFFVKAMDSLFEFHDLGYAIRNMAGLLENPQEIQQEQYAKMGIFLDAICEDLRSWHTNIFIDQSTQDIHYLDSSLLSSCLQMEMIFSSEELEQDSEDDLELF